MSGLIVPLKPLQTTESESFYLITPGKPPTTPSPALTVTLKLKSAEKVKQFMTYRFKSESLNLFAQIGPIKAETRGTFSHVISR